MPPDKVAFFFKTKIMLKLGKREKVFYDTEEIDSDKVNLEDFFVSNLSEPIEFGEDLRLEDLLNHYSGIQDFIYQYFAEQYYRLKVIVLSKTNTKHYVGVRFFKKLIISDGEVSFQPSFDFITSGSGYKEKEFMAQLPVIIDDKVQIIEEIEGEYINKGELTCQVTFLDVTEALFSDLVYDLTEGSTEV